MGQIGSKSGVFKVFQIFLKIGSKDFSDFLPKVSGQHRLTTGENRLFRKNLNFAPGGLKMAQNVTPENGDFFIFFFAFSDSESLNSQKKAIHFFCLCFDPF